MHDRMSWSWSPGRNARPAGKRPLNCFAARSRLQGPVLIFLGDFAFCHLLHGSIPSELLCASLLDDLCLGYGDSPLGEIVDHRASQAP